MEIAKRLNAIIAQLLPFLSQEVGVDDDDVGVDVDDEYSFIFKILTQMEDEWEHNVNRVYTVPDELTINGKRYTS